MENLRFGNLLVIECVGRNNRQEKLWKCVCNCGKEKLVKSYNLKSGQTKSCGCIKTGPKEKDYVGKKFNRLTVLKRAGKSKCRQQILECECECGVKKIVLLRNLKNENTKSCGCLNVELKKNAIGEKNPNYNPNLTAEERINGRNIQNYDDWSKAVKVRDNYTCQCCFKSKSGEMVSHHIFSYHSNEDIRCDLKNGVCLCEECHKKFHKSFGLKNNTKEQFKQFLKENISNE